MSRARRNRRIASEGAVEDEDDLEAQARRRNSRAKRFDASELTLFKATVKKAGGKHKEALALLEREEANVVDRVAYLTLLGELQVELGMMSAAEETYWKLIDRLPDSYDYHKALRIVKGLPEHVHDGTGEITDDDVAKLLSLIHI